MASRGDEMMTPISGDKLITEEYSPMGMTLSPMSPNQTPGLSCPQSKHYHTMGQHKHEN